MNVTILSEHVTFKFGKNFHGGEYYLQAVDVAD